MEINNLKKNASNATRWSIITQLLVKLITPITSMILARILIPEYFGIIASISMVISFIELITDAGFGKYLIQQPLTKTQIKDFASVAFWSNLVFVILFLALIIVKIDLVCKILGDKTIGLAVIIACMQLPITAFSNIQIALLKRDLNFKFLFYTSTCSALVPFVTTIPLALMGFNYWSLVFGTLAGKLVESIILFCFSEWKPRFYYDFNSLKKMISFSIWTLLESVSIWFSQWSDILIISSAFSAYNLGIYRTSLNVINSILIIVTASVIPVLFSTLSKLQSDKREFEKMFYFAQKSMAYVLFPIGIGIFLFSDFATFILLGDKWKDASVIIGIWSITSVFKIVLSDLNSECFRAMGRPRLSFTLQMIHIVFLLGACMYSTRFGFTAFFYTRTFIRFQLVIFSMIAMHYVLGISMFSTIKNLAKPTLFGVIMYAIGFMLKQVSTNQVWYAAVIVICAITYCALILVLARNDFEWLFKKIDTTRFFRRRYAKSCD